MPDGLYERDALAWSEEQAELLRRLAAGERVNDSVDWANVIEEVEDVGKSQLRACRSLLRQAIAHLLKMHAWPESGSIGHWQDEVGAFLDDARDSFSPSMQQHIDLADIYARASRRVHSTRDRSGPGRAWPEVCPFTLEELLGGDVDALLARARAGATGD